MKSFPRQTNYYTPLAVSFHCWEDQCCPMLEFSQFISVKPHRSLIPKSSVWSSPHITSVIFAGSTTGTIVAYQVLSQNQELIDVLPICLICGHSTEITSFTEVDSKIHDQCVASLSYDGTLSIISVEDFTIISHHPTLFSESSQHLAFHKEYHRLMIASQSYGTLEIADIQENSLLYRITGFPSIITSLSSNKELICVSCADGSLSIFSFFEDKPTCIGTYSTDISDSYPFYSSKISPDRKHILTLSSNKWIVSNSTSILYEQHIQKPDDSYVLFEWVSNNTFFISTLSGRVELYGVDSTSEASTVFRRLKSRKGIFQVSTINGKYFIESQPVSEQDTTHTITEPDKNKKLPTLKLSTDCSSDMFKSQFHVTPEEFIVTSPGKSILIFQTKNNIQYVYNLSKYFKSKYRCRCAIGDPIIHEARIGINNEIYIDNFNNKIGEHKDANILFAPPKINIFFSFSRNGSIKAWSIVSKTLRTTFYDLSEPINKVQWLESKELMLVIGSISSFTIIDPKNLFPLITCTNLNSPIIDIIFKDSLFHVRCQLSTIYTYNMNGDLVSKRKSMVIKKLGKTQDLQPKLQSASVPNISGKTIDLKKPIFSKVLQLIIPNCQTFVIVFDIIKFFNSFESFDNLPLRTDPSFLALKLLWKCHIGKGKVDLCDDIGILNSFNYAIAGDNFTVTLPIKLKSNKRYQSNMLRSIGTLQTIPEQLKFTKKVTMSKIILDNKIQEKDEITTEIAFSFSPYLTAIHGVAATAIGKCFVNVKNDESLPLVLMLSQVATSQKLLDSVKPSMYVLASWIDSPYEYLRSATIDVLQNEFTKINNEQSSEIIKSIHEKFANFNITLPFVFMHCKRYKIDPIFAIECTHHLFPYILENNDAILLLLEGFRIFSEYIKDLKLFFLNLINAKNISINKTIRFALIRPLEFFEAIITTNKYLTFIELLMERWKPTERDLLIAFIKNIIVAKVMNIPIDYITIFKIITSKMHFISFCQRFIAFGNTEGEIIIISFDTGAVLWRQRVYLNQIDFVSISPSANSFIFASLTDKVLTWAEQVKDKKSNNINFELIGSQEIKFIIIPSAFVWKNENKIVLFNNNEKIFEANKPNTSFLRRLKFG